MAKSLHSKFKAWLIVSLLGGGLALFAHSMIIPATAYLSIHLLNHAWERTLDGDMNAKPWPWMDSRAVARIKFNDQNKKSFIVMQGTSGQVLAFAPGWHEQTALPGKTGISVLSAHRDTHFQVLKDVQTGDSFKVQTPDGKWQSYEITQRFVTDEPHISMPADSAQTMIYLTTCYPFNSISARTSQRYIVAAVRVS